MPEYLAPGIYYQRVDSTRRGITNLRTDIAGFVGIATMGPLHTPVVVESYRQFESHFGSFTGNGYLAYAVRGFFENGGARCYVVRVAGYSSKPAQFMINDIDGQPAWRIRASSNGIWGNKLSVAVQTQRVAKTTSSVDDFDMHSGEVESLSALVRGGLVKIYQDGKTWWRVLSTIDGGRQRIYWSHPDPERRLDSDQAITDFDYSKPLSITAVSYSITVRQDSRVLAHYADLGLVAELPRAATRILAMPDYRIDISDTVTLPSPAEPIVVEDMRRVVSTPLLVSAKQFFLEGGQNGLASLTASDFTGELWGAGDSDQIRFGKTRGLQALDDIDEVAILAIPDIHIHPDPDPVFQPIEYPEPDPCISCPEQPEPQIRFTVPNSFSDIPPIFDENAIYQVQMAMIDQCARHNDRIALIDPPLAAADGGAQGIAPVRDWRSRFDSRYAALYFPWLDVPDIRSRQSIVRRIPACGHVAGQYAGKDLSAGVHNAPANQRLQWVRNVSVGIDASSHGVLNPEGVNAIRTDASRGIRILGARTLSSDPDWRYVNVQRLFMMVMEAITVALQWVVFEGNDNATRGRVYMTLYGFLNALWQQGALVGDEPSQAFFIRCDEVNNPPPVRDNGQLIAEVGIAPSVPFEFIVLRVGRRGNTLEIENIGLGRAA